MQDVLRLAARGSTLKSGQQLSNGDGAPICSHESVVGYYSVELVEVRQQGLRIRAVRRPRSLVRGRGDLHGDPLEAHTPSRETSARSTKVRAVLGR